jgi:transketolase
MQNRSNRVYCLIGDGESDEGSTWESIEVIAQQKLSNLTIILDQNGQKIGGAIENPRNFQAIYESLGFDTETIDGHNHEQLIKALTSEPENRDPRSPRCVIAKTIKGKGVSSLESSPNNHSCVLSDQDFSTALSDNRINLADLIDPAGYHA